MSKRKLLLADDSVTIQKVVNLTFADEGIEVISVGDGDSAMEKVAEISPDLIMADVNMPGLTGYEICERIRQDEKLKQTPVILLVGSFEPFDEDEARRVGADDFLTKPFQSIRQLVNKVTVLLNSRSTQNGDGTTDVSSLEDTLEMDVDDISANAQPSQYADTSFDDEMIQTNRPSSFAFDETQKFESRETGELGYEPKFEAQETSAVEQFEETSRPEPVSEEAEGFTYETQESINDESGETESPVLEINDKERFAPEIERFAPEIERNEYAYELETSNGVSYEIKDDEPETIKDDESDTIKEETSAETESFAEKTDSDEVEAQTDTPADEIKDDVSEEVEDPESASYQIEETVGEQSVEDSYQPVSYEIKDEDDILEEKSGEISDGIKDYDLVSGETEESNEIPEEPISQEIEETASPEIETVTDESENQVELESEQTELTQKTPEEEIPLPEYASVLEFDDDDILQLPPIESEAEEEEIEIKPMAQAPAGIVISPSATAASFAPKTESNPVIDSTQISPEIIEMIVTKVMERLSEKAVKEVAWEVVPQMSELIIKKLAEEKLK